MEGDAAAAGHDTVTLRAQGGQLTWWPCRTQQAKQGLAKMLRIAPGTRTWELEEYWQKASITDPPGCGEILFSQAGGSD